MADFNKLADDLIQEIHDFGITYGVMAKHLGISRQAFDRRKNSHALTTEDLTRLAAMSVTWCGGSVLVDFYESDAQRTAQSKNNVESESKGDMLYKTDFAKEDFSELAKVVDDEVVEITVVPGEQLTNQSKDKETEQ